MKKVKKLLALTIILCSIITILPISISAAQTDIVLECENGVITGAATQKENNNIQDGYNGSKVVGMSGVSSDPTLATTITFSNVEISQDGNYKFTLSYDTNNDATKKVDLLVDNVRYNFPIPDKSELPSAWNLGLYKAEILVPVKAGSHTFAVTTSLDFNRDSSNPDTYVKSVNADSLTVQYDSEIPSETTTTSQPTTTTSQPTTKSQSTTQSNNSTQSSVTQTVPKTGESFPVMPALFLLSGAIVIAVVYKKKSTSI